LPGLCIVIEGVRYEVEPAAALADRHVDSLDASTPTACRTQG
jgi:hypothetical protein